MIPQGEDEGDEDEESLCSSPLLPDSSTMTMTTTMTMPFSPAPSFDEEVEIVDGLDFDLSASFRSLYRQLFEGDQGRLKTALL